MAQLSHMPLYRKVEQHIAKRIASGTLGAGARLPNEFELAAEYGVSQGTARKALQALEARGMVSRAPGRGTIVAVSTPEDALYSFFRMRDPSDALAVPEANLETITRRARRPEDADFLGPSAADVYELVRVRNWRGAPFIDETIVLCADIFDGLEHHGTLPVSLYPFLQEKYGVTITRTEERLSAMAADATLAERLGVSTATPLLRSIRVAYDLQDRSVEYRRTHMRTEEASFAVTLHRDRVPHDLPPRG